MRGGVGAALAHAQDARVAARLEAGGVEDLGLELHFLGDLGGAFGQVLRRHDVARFADHVAGAVHVLRDPRVASLARLGVRLVVGVRDDRDLGFLR